MQNVTMQGVLQQRADKVAYMFVPDDGMVDTFHRMQGFTEKSQSKNPIEYSRQYVDEAFERTDVVGFSPQWDFNFDRHTGNVVHDFLCEIIDNEVIGTPAQVRIMLIDFTKGADEDNAVVRTFSTIPDTEGDVLEAYTYGGSFRVVGPRIVGVAALSADGATATFVESSAVAFP